MYGRPRMRRGPLIQAPEITPHGFAGSPYAAVTNPRQGRYSRYV